MSALQVPLNPATTIRDTARQLSQQNSLFEGHALQVQHTKPIIHYSNYDYVIAGVLFVAFLFFVWMYSQNRKRLGQLIKAFYVNRFANQLLREEVSVGNRMTAVLSVLFVLTLSLFAVQANSYFGWMAFKNGPLAYFVIAGSIFLAYGIKLLGIRIVGWVFQVKREASDYIFTVFLFGNSLGLFLLPVVVCLAFVRQIQAGYFVYFGLFLVASFLAVRLVRGVVIGYNSSRVSKFYLFLYLCTLEIVPLMVLLKLFMINLK